MKSQTLQEYLDERTFGGFWFFRKNEPTNRINIYELKDIINFYKQKFCKEIFFIDNNSLISPKIDSGFINNKGDKIYLSRSFPIFSGFSLNKNCDVIYGRNLVPLNWFKDKTLDEVIYKLRDKGIPDNFNEKNYSIKFLFNL